jgi:hypothetical protein
MRAGKTIVSLMPGYGCVDHGIKVCRRAQRLTPA